MTCVHAYIINMSHPSRVGWREDIKIARLKMEMKCLISDPRCLPSAVLMITRWLMIDDDLKLTTGKEGPEQEMSLKDTVLDWFHNSFKAFLVDPK